MNATPPAAKVFVSYTRADDAVFVPDTQGWVTSFADHLQKALTMQEGGRGIRIWIDHGLAPQQSLDVALPQQLREAAAFLAMLSPGYISSSWCPQELAWFIQSRGGGTDERVFMAELRPTPGLREQLHPATHGLVPSVFWEHPSHQKSAHTLGWPVAGKEDRAYWRQLCELAHSLAERLRADAQACAAPQRPKVWIAPTTDDVHPRWEELAAALRQAGYEVLPTSEVEDARSEAELREALRPALDEAAVLVQLLGAAPGRVRGSLGAPLHQCLHPLMREAAQRRTLPMWVWRPPELQPPTVADAAHRQLLTGTTACGFQEFIGLVQQAVPKAPPPPTEPRDATATALGESTEVPTVCLTADAVDHPLSETVADVLADLGAMVVTPTAVADHADPSAWRQHNDALMSEADGLLLLYGQAPASWVQSQLLAARKTLSLRRSRTRLSLLDAPPPQKPPAAWRLPNLLTLDCRQGLQREPLARFVDQLRAGGRHV